jgi:predicted O-methyltransferase YrrM
MLSRARRRTLRFGLSTVLGLARRGYFIPMRNAPASAAWEGRAYEALRARFDAAAPAFRAHLAHIDALGADLDALRGPPPEPRFDQGWFPRLDAAALYTLVREARPERIVEVGSGHSTRFLARAIRDGALAAHLTAIDPEPRADLGGLAVTLLRQTLQDAGLAPFAGLAAGDLILVDSSHVLMPGTDVDILLNHVVPALPRGTLVGFHDIFLPDAYPPAWPFTVYNEQNAVAPLLLSAEIVWASAYVVRHMARDVASSWAGRQPLAAEARESLLVLRL